MKRKIIITGATGFLGGRLARRLTEVGFEVVGIGRNSNAGAALEQDGIEFCRADLTDSKRLTEVCRNAEFCFHCGAKSSLWGSYRSFYEANVTATDNVLIACRKNNLRRVVHISTPGIFFDYRDKFNIREDDPLPERFVNHYAATKKLAEDAVSRAAAAGLDAVIIRPRAIIGSGDTALLPRLLRANRTRFLPRPEQDILIDVTHVDNLVSALLAAMECPAARGRTYHITNGEPIYLFAFLTELLERLDIPANFRSIPKEQLLLLATGIEWFSKLFRPWREPSFTRYSAALLVFNQTLDITRAKTELGYSPTVSMRDAMNDLVANYSEEQ